MLVWRVVSLRRVVVTGIGVIAPNGIGKESFFQALASGKSGVKSISFFDASNFSTKIAAEVRDFKPEEFLTPKEIRRNDRFTQFALACAQMALEDSQLDLNSFEPERAGAIVGSGIGGIFTLEEEHKKLLEKGPERISPFLIPMMIVNMASGIIAIKFNLKGVSYTTVSACSSSANAIGEAFETIKRGAIDVCLTGGVESSITPLSVGGFCALKALSTRNDEPEKASRPFDKDRDGFVMGEGGAILVLEELEHALSRKAKIYAEVVGYGCTSDAYHITAPDPEAEQPARAMLMALEEGGLEPESVGYINAHGTSTYFNDEIETLAIKKAFKSHAYKLLVSSTKSMTGHLLGAAGAIEAVATILTLERGVVFPTINLDNPDPQCDLNYVPHHTIEKNVEVALSNSLGFGGHNVSLAFKKWKD